MLQAFAFLSRNGVFVIGRNEAERLLRSLESVSALAQNVVYVDSGSTNGSAQRPEELPLVQPFTAGRARNAGFTALLEIDPDVDLVKFLDGDCILGTGWLATARGFLEARPTDAIG